MDTCSPINLSVIVPVYNASQYLHACIDSILAVDRQDMELLLVDDGSTDKSGTICDEYAGKDKRIKVFHKPNGGVSSARNVGIDNAQGKWLTFVDADDKATEALLRYQPDDNTDLVCFNWEYTTGEREHEELTSGVYREKELIDFLFKHLVDYVFRTPWAKLFKTSIIKENSILFDYKFSLGEDTLFVTEYLCHSQTIKTNERIGYIYQRPDKRKYGKPLKECIEYLEAYLPVYKKLPVRCPKLIALKDLYYFDMVEKSSNINRWEWESYPIVWTMQKERLSVIPFQERIKVLLRHLLIKCNIRIK